jgi:glycerophosphoryl diester phosphodiesterase
VEKSRNSMNFIPSTPLNIAHRGARSLAPENTLAAARKALEIGADLWELDVCMTADRKLILLHDDTLPRTSNATKVFPDRSPWRACDFTLAEIRRLDFGSWFVHQDPFGQIATGAVSPMMQGTYHSEAAPTLREALEFTRQNQWAVNVEIKDLRGSPGHADVSELVAAMVRSMGMVSSVLVSSFNHDYLVRCRKAVPEIMTAALASFPILAPLRLLRRLGASALNPAEQFAFPALIRAIRAAGFGVNVYTVNDPTRMRGLINAGASGIFTDFPQVLGPILKG